MALLKMILQWRKSIGSGKKCNACKERCFLFEYRPYISVDNRRSWKLLKKRLRLCQSCGELLCSD